MSDRTIPGPDDKMPDLDELLAMFLIDGASVMARILMGRADGEAIRAAVKADRAELHFAVEVGPTLAVIAYAAPDDGPHVPLGEWRPDVRQARAKLN